MKNEEYKTIKELADDLGVTKQTVQYHYKSFADKGAIFLDRRLQELLKEELNNKDEIIIELLENQKNLQKLLDQQQFLTLHANQKIEQLEMNQVESEKKEKLSFWQRLFRK